jgi:UDP-GlcNAc:undecaprenyl-phosphate GlcNAc-1-phosphate transferase
MLKIIPVTLFFLSFFASLVSNAILRKLATEKQILIDSPDKHRKFHSKPTPLTGGIGISIGIIFSALFLFLFSNLSFNNEISTENLIGNSQNLLKSGIEIESNENFDLFEVDLDDEVKRILDENNKILLKRINENSFAIINSSGEVKVYEIASEVNVKDQNRNNFITINNFNIGLILFTIIVQCVMILDDLRGLDPKSRLFLQSLSVLGLILVSDIYIVSLGNLFGFGEINLGMLGIPFTVFCIVGIMNAFNMIDGLNGLCASLCLVCFIAIIFMINADTISSLFPLIIPVGAIVGFLMYNLGILGDQRTVFLGDNGSNALGFMCAWILVYFSSVEDSSFAPITALWLVAIPFIDALGVMASRAIKGIKPFRPGRDHIHHKLLASGLSQEAIYGILIGFSVFLAYVGITLNWYFPVNHYYSFYAFIILWACYNLVTRKIFKNV